LGIEQNFCKVQYSLNSISELRGSHMTAPLAGYTVLDLSTVISGPFATCILAEHGARVIKIEAPGMGDVARFVGTSKGGMTAMYASVNRGKEILTLDLKQADAQKILWDLIAKADVLVQNFRPGVMDRIGFGHAAVAAKNPALIYVSISGFGQSGPRASTRVYDPVIQAAAGVCDSQRTPGTNEPMLYQGILCDKVTALTAAQSVMAALLARERGLALGQHIDIAMLDTAIHFHWPDGMYNYTFQDTDGIKSVPDFSAFYRLTPHEDRHFAMSLTTETEQQAFLRALGLEHLNDDPRFNTLSARLAHKTEMEALVQEKLQQMTPEQALDKMLAEDVPVSLVTRRAALHDDPQVNHNQTIAKISDTQLGTLHVARSPINYEQTKTLCHDTLPRHGAAAAALLAELGYAENECDRLISSGAVA
jgi:crotonobetainyl-CoA:carnitine CoA-transferase CaiB-like acyl-CoA transferase